MSSTTNTDYQTILNNLIEAFIPTLNDKLPDWISSQGLDPMASVISGDDTLGKINLGICTASAKASYDVKNMKGLSSLQIDSATLVIDDDASPSSITGTISMDAKLGDSLTTDAGGKIKAACGILSESVGISGSADASGVTGTIELNYTASVSSSEAELLNLDITSMSLNYSDLKVKIDGLGIFNDFLEPLEDLIFGVLGDWIKDTLSGVVEPIITSLLGDLVPFSISLT